MRPPIEPGHHGNIHTTKRGGKWVARTRYRDERGNLKDTTASGKTKSEALHRLQTRLTTTTSNHADTTLKDFADLWYETYKTTVSTNTARISEQIIRNHIYPVGQIRLRQITVLWCEKRIQDALVEKHKTNRTGQVYKSGGRSTAMRLRTMLKMILAEAVRLDAIPTNPADATKSIPKKTPEPVALSLDELKTLRANVRAYYTMTPTRIKAARFMPDLVDFLAGTGCRVGEALALKWDDVNLAEGVVTIRSTVVRDTSTGESVFQPFTKTRQTRVISIPGWLSELLSGRERESEYVFVSSTGTLLRYGRVKENFQKATGTTYTLKIIRSTVATLIEREMGYQAAGLQLGHEGYENLRSYVARHGVADAREVLELV